MNPSTNPPIRFHFYTLTCLLAGSLFLSACQGASLTAAREELPSAAAVPTTAVPAAATPSEKPPAPTQTATATPTPSVQLVTTPEPVDLTAPLIYALSSRSCEHPVPLPPSDVFDRQQGPQAIIAGGQVQSGDFTFGTWLYCSEKQGNSDPDAWNPYTNLRGLALYIEWLYEGPAPDDSINCYHGFEPDITPDRGWSAFCGKLGGLGLGFQLPKKRLDQLTAAETPFRYVFKATAADEQPQGITLSFTLRRVNDGFVIANVETAPLTKTEREMALPTPYPQPAPPDESIPSPQVDREQFVDTLLEDLDARRFSKIKSLMSEDFDLQFVPLGNPAHGREEAAQILENSAFLSDHPQITRRNPPSERFRRGFPGKAAPAIYALETTGWGLSGQDQGYITIGLEDNQLRWTGLLLYEDSYTPLPWLETGPTPAGLIYRNDDLYYQAAADGTSLLLFGHEPPVGFAPDGSAAMF